MIGAKGVRALLAGVKAVILSTNGRGQPVPYNNSIYRQRNLIERMFARLKDFRRVAIRYDKLLLDWRTSRSSPGLVAQSSPESSQPRQIP